MSEMKLIMERWESFLITEQEEQEPQSLGQKAASGLGKISSVIAKGFNKMDDYVRQDYCEKNFHST